MSATDPAPTLAEGMDSPCSKGFAITKNDSADLPFITRAIYVGGAGDISVILAKDSAAVTLVGAVAGTVLPIRAKRVRSTGTTASNLVGLY